MVYEGEIQNIEMLAISWAGLLEDLAGREMTDDEFDELNRLLRATCRMARNLPDEDLEEEQ